jgi:uncharacterized membrane protein YqjE
MDPESAEREIPGQTATSGDPAERSGVLDDVRSLWHELRELFADRFRLAALETQQAGKSLVGMMVAGMIMTVLLSGAWLGLMAAAVMAMIEKGVPASEALLLAVACNLLFALILWGVIRRKSHYLRFPATLRSLQALPEAQEDVEPS